MSADRSMIVAFLSLAALAAAQPVCAQTVAKPGEPAKATDAKASEAAKAFTTGTKAFETGKTDAAVTALSSAITSGGLKNPELAKAMFYRGVAYRSQKKLAAALSDLNAAVWLRDGLSPTDKAVAQDHRQALLREIAALNGVAAPIETAAVSSPAVLPVTAAPAAQPAEVPKPAETMPWTKAEEPVAAPAVQAPVLADAPAATVASASPSAAPQEPQSAEIMPWADAAGKAPQPAAEAPVGATTEAIATPVAQATPAVQPAEDNAAASTDTIAEPVAQVAPVERAHINTVQAEPAPPEKPLPWQAPTVAVAEQAPSTPLSTDTISEPVVRTAPVERGQIDTVAATPVAPEKPLPWHVPTETAKVEAASPWATTAPVSAPVATAALSSAETAPSKAPTPAASLAMASEPATSQGAAAPSVTEAPTVLADAGKAAGAFLGNLFSGGAASAAPPSVEPTAQPAAFAAVEPSQPPAPAPAAKAIETAALPDRPASPAPAIAAWSSRAEEAPPTASSGDAKVKIAASEPDTAKAEATPAVAALPGPFRLQISAENTREDAEKTLARLISGHGPSLRGIQPVIEEPATGGILFGSTGAAYRVSLGPYATSAEPGRLCNILKPHEFDCRVVAVTP